MMDRLGNSGRSWVLYPVCAHSPFEIMTEAGTSTQRGLHSCITKGNQ
jgi:hypothetical protein